MSDLLARPFLRRSEPAWGSRVPWLAALLATGWTLVAGLAVCVLPGTSMWLADGAETPLADPLRFGARVWLLGHHVGVEVGSVDLSIAPLGLTIVFVLLLYRSARWAAHSAGVSTSRGALAVIIPAVVAYVVGAGVVAGLAGTPDVTIVPVEAVGWAGFWATVTVVAGVGVDSGLAHQWLGRLSVPAEARAAAAGVVAVLAGVVAAGSALVAISTMANAGRVGGLAEALDAGVLGNALLVLGSVAVVPNAVLWAGVFALGPGFAVGAGTSVAPGGVDLGLVPAIPLLGALPADVPGGVTWLVLAGPAAAGAVGGLVVSRRIPADLRSVPRTLSAAAGSAGAAAVGMSVLAYLSGGAAGSGRLSVIGPVPWQAALATVVVVGVPMLSAAALHAYRTVDRSGATGAS